MMRVQTALVVLLVGSPAVAAEPPTPLLAGGCQGCHGVAGRGSSGIPAIAGTRSRAEFEGMMKAFRANEREATIMGRIARGYTDAEIAALAAHFGRDQ